MRRLVWSSEIEAARRRVNEGLRQRFGSALGVHLLEDQVLVADTDADYLDTLHFRPEAYPKLEAAALNAIEALKSARPRPPESEGK